MRLDSAGLGGSEGVVFELDVLGNSNERSDNLTSESGKIGDDALEVPEITSGEGEVYDHRG